MKIKYAFITMGLLLTAQAIHAQDFDADSIYYTPFLKRAENDALTSTPRQIFRDTVQNDELIQYFFNVQAGPLIGCKDCVTGKEVTFTSSTIHGITIGKKLRAGVGIGFDSYAAWQMIPLFGSASWDLIGTRNTPALFAQFNYGWSKAWRIQSPMDYGFTSVDGGKTMSGLFGCRIKYHDANISLAAGWKFQRAYSYFESPSYYYLEDGTMVVGSPNRTAIEHDMNRFMLSLAVGWK